MAAMPPDFPWLAWILGLIGAYLLGSIPFGLIISLAHGVDVRKFGSGNIGASNVGRTLGRRWGVLTFLLDMLKGCLPVVAGGFMLGTIARHDTSNALAGAWLAFGVAAFMGHLFSIFLRFRGGKGVATGFGAVLGVFPILTIPAIISIVVWAISVKVTRYIGFSSCIAGLLLPIWTIFLPAASAAIGFFHGSPAPQSIWPDWSMLWPYFTVSMALALFVVYRHRANFARMLAGTEIRVGEGARPIAGGPGVQPAAPGMPDGAITQDHAHEPTLATGQQH
jgi:glycerol-3-phosphate acyltransferase PlsY